MRKFRLYANGQPRHKFIEIFAPDAEYAYVARRDYAPSYDRDMSIVDMVTGTVRKFRTINGKVVQYK